MENLGLISGKNKIGELLLEAGKISNKQLQHAIEEQSKHGQKLGDHLLALGYIDENTLARFLAMRYELPFVHLSDMEIDIECTKKVPIKTALEHTMMPLFISDNEITIAISDPSALTALDNIKFMTGLHVAPVVSLKSDILKNIKEFYNLHDRDVVEDSIEAFSSELEKNENLEVIRQEEDLSLSELMRATEDAPIVKLSNFIVTDAINKKASDIHIEPYSKTLRIRFRIDGVLKTMVTPPKYLHPALVSRLKIMCDLDITERRLPQDGRMMLKIENRTVDFRLSFISGLYGEKVVIRILNKSDLILDTKKLGLEKEALEKFEKAIHSPNGMILVTGPTGSGKTTTLYSALHTINNEDLNIITAEDPIEFNLEGINQIQMKDKIGLNFPTALRSFLRQDPDVIMVGEIRDLETANIAVKAVLTGHLVFSTLHTMDAPSTVMRLINMGIDSLLVASSLSLIVAQRLIRAICKNCMAEETVSEEALIHMGFKPDEAKTVKCYKGRGCDVCNNTGYKGRVAIYEMMSISRSIREMILKGASTMELKKEAVRLGMDTLRVSGLKKIGQGVTSVEEVLRVTFEEED